MILPKRLIIIKAMFRLGLLSVLVLAAVPSYSATVEDVRVWRAPDHTRVVLDLSGPVTHKVMTLESPTRIVVDIDSAKMRADLTGLDFQDSPVFRVRSGVKDKTGLRVVLDVNSSVKPRSFLLPKNDQYRDRLVVDLYDRKQKNQDS